MSTSQLTVSDLIKNQKILNEIIQKVKDKISNNIKNESMIQLTLDVVNDGYFNLEDEYCQQCETLNEISPVLSFINMYAGYSYQVTNGGHTQYFDNGYASGMRGCMRKDNRNTDMHDEKFKPLFLNLGLNSTEIGSGVYDVIKNFKICYFEEDEIGYSTCMCCSGEGTIINEETDDDGDIISEESEECDNCYGQGEIEETISEAGIQNDHQLNSLDDEYYEIYEKFEIELNEYIKEWIETNGTVWKPFNK